MKEDAEIEAMTAIARVLDALDETARWRVLSWAAARFGGRPIAGEVMVGGERPASASGSNSANFETFAELVDAADPKTDRARALVAAYWQQVCEGQQNFPAQTLNTNLKNLGYRLSNITVSLEGLKSERPALVLQLKKDGTSRQARKTYKLTHEGIRRVEAMIAKEDL